jgi:hypothetical protein
VSLLRPQPDDGGGIPWALLVFLLPVLARLGRALLVALGLAKPEPDEGTLEPREERQRQRVEEDEGTDLFERLARGEAPEPARAPAPLPRAQPVSLEISLESEAEPEPLSVLGPAADAREPSEAPEFSLERAAASEVSLESEVEPAPLSALDRGAALSEAPPLAVSARAFRLLGGDLRRAVLLSEILGPPLSERAVR